MSNPTKILSVLVNVRRQSPGSSKEANSWMARCPAHDDSTPSLWIKHDRVKDRIVLYCHGPCNEGQVREALYRKGITPDDLGGKFRPSFGSKIQLVYPDKPTQPEKPIEGCTVEQLAAVKKLPIDFLQKEFLLKDTIWRENRRTTPAVLIPYLDFEGNLVTQRYRVGINGQKFRAPKFQPMLYGLWGLNGLKEGDRVLIVEGESDVWTCWYLEKAAVGVPGAKQWKSEWSKYLRNFQVIVWQEPDEAGKDFAQRVTHDLPGAIVIKGTHEEKDISCLHITKQQ